MKSRIPVGNRATLTALLVMATALWSVNAQNQTPANAPPPAAPRYVSVIGTIEKVDSGAKSLALKTDKGEQLTIKFGDGTQFVQMPASETDTKKGTRATAADVSAGDRVIARILPGDQGMPAVFLYFIKQSGN